MVTTADSWWNNVKYSLVKSILWYIFDGIYWEYHGIFIELPIDIVFFMGQSMITIGFIKLDVYIYNQDDVSP